MEVFFEEKTTKGFDGLNSELTIADKLLQFWLYNHYSFCLIALSYFSILKL